MRTEPKSTRRRQAGAIESLGWFEVPGFPSRELRLYRPAEDDRRTPRPLLLAFDGQNAFGDEGTFAGGWHLHAALDGMDRRRYVAPYVVAIPHGGETRQEELTPWPIEGRGGRTDAFLDWVVGALLPELEGRLPLIRGPLGTAVIGASWGGLAALYAHYRHPERFGGALALSPSCWVGDFAIFGFLSARPTPAVSRVYLDCGGREAGGRMLPAAQALAERLSERGYPRRQLWWRPDPDGEHNEAAWRRRLPRAVRFMYRR
jgi:enterochelin esterase-like enzyme